MTLSGMIHYGTTKTDQLAVVRGLAKLTKGTQATISSLLPGPTPSEGVEKFLEELAGEDKNREEARHGFFRDAQPSSLLQRFITVTRLQARPLI